MIPSRVQLYALGALLGLLGLSYAVAAHYKGQAAEAVQKATLAEGRAQALEGIAQGKDAAMAEAAAQSKAIAAENVALKAKLASRPLPPPAAPAPADDGSLGTGLVSAGLLSGLQIHAGLVPSNLAHADAVKVWDWQAEAARVPPLMARLTASEELNAGQERQVQSVSLERDAAAQAREAWKASASEEQRRADFEAGARKDLQKALDAEKTKRRLLVLGALAAGYAAAKRL